jgi:flagellar biosynthesis/type III secretory pathway M-ring protein FliF/YscJ
MLGVLVAIGLAVLQFPTPATSGTPAIGPPVPAVAAGHTAGTGDSLTVAAQSALDQILGPGHSVVAASADYGPGSSTLSSRYDPKRVAALSRSQSTGPGYQASVTDNGVSRTVTRSSSAGSLQRLSVSVVVDSGLTPAPKLATIRQAVTAAMGLRKARGDTITVARAAIPANAPVASASGATGVASVTAYLRSAFFVAAAIVLLLTLATDAIRRRRRT